MKYLVYPTESYLFYSCKKITQTSLSLNLSLERKEEIFCSYNKTEIPQTTIGHALSYLLSFKSDTAFINLRNYE